VTGMSVTRPRHSGVRLELARYVVGGVERALCGQRVEGVVRVTDVPVSFAAARISSSAGLSRRALKPTRTVMSDTAALPVRSVRSLGRLSRGGVHGRRTSVKSGFGYL
jgi:hypothetical protein